jgi:4-hydroxybenzoate polyprenyltransferase
MPVTDAQTSAPSPSPSTGDVLRGYLLLPHAVPIIVVMTATAALALVAAGGWPATGALLRLLGSMLGGQVAIGAINELVDVELDRLSRPDKPIPAGLVSVRGARVMAGAGIAVKAVLGATFGPLPLVLIIIGTGTGIAYSLWFKHTIWSWVPYLIALPLLPIWVWSALDQIDAAMFAVYPIGASAVISVQLAQSLPDVEADRAAGVRTLAVALGADRARLACWVAMLFASGLGVALAPWLTARPGLVWIAAGIVVVLVAANVLLWTRDHRRGVLACFPLMASGVVILGVAWVAALVA